MHYALHFLLVALCQKLDDVTAFLHGFKDMKAQILTVP